MAEMTTNQITPPVPPATAPLIGQGGPVDRPQVPPPRQAPEVKPSERAMEQAKKAVEARSKESHQVILGSYIAPRRLRLDVFEATGDFFAKVVRSDNGKVLRTVPPMALLKTKARMEEYLGMLLDHYG